jgi:hypothetical protein
MLTLNGVGESPYRIETPYRMHAARPRPEAAPPDPYLGAWRRLRVWRSIAFLGLGGYCANIFLVAPLIGGRCLPFAIAMAICGMVATMRVSWWDCPRCRKPFGTRDPFWGPHSPMVLFRRRCLHCGIPIGTCATLPR